MPVRAPSGPCYARLEVAQYQTIEQVQAARAKRQGVFEKALAMRDGGQISEAEFRMLDAKFREKMAELDAAEAALAPAAPPAAPAPPVQADEVLGMARDILGSSGVHSRPSGLEAEQGGPLAPSGEGLPGLAPTADPSAEAIARAPTPPAGTALEAILGPGAEAPASLPFEDSPTIPPIPQRGPILPDPGGPGGAVPAVADEDDDDGFEDSHPDPFGDEGPPRGLAEMTEMAGDLAEEDLDHHPASFGLASDGDLMSLVRGSGGGGGGDDAEGLKIKLQTERSAREQAEKQAKAKAKEASDMHEAFTRTVETKDRMGDRIVAQRQEIEALEAQRLKLAGALVAAVVLLVGWRVSTARNLGIEVSAARAEVAKLEGLRKDAQDARARAEADLARLQPRVRGLEDDAEEARRDRDDAQRSERQLQARVAELEAELAAAEQAAARRPSAPAGPALDDESLLDLIHARLADLKTPLPAFVGGLPAEHPELVAVERTLRSLPAERRTPLAELARAALLGDLQRAQDAAAQARSHAEGEMVRLDALLGSLLLASGKPEEAAPLLERAVEADPESTGAKLDLAEAYVKLRRRDEARALVDVLRTSLGDEVGSLLRLGTVAERCFASQAAGEVYRKVLDLDPDSSRALVALSGIEIEGADFAGARDHLQRALERDPENLEAQYNLALASLGLGDQAAARAAVARLREGGWRDQDVRDLEARLADAGEAPDAPEQPAGG